MLRNYWNGSKSTLCEHNWLRFDVTEIFDGARHKKYRCSKQFFGWIESKNKEEEFSTYQNRIKALKKKKREVEKVRAESDGDHPATSICPYEYIPSISFNKNVSDFLTQLFEKAIENIVIYERDSVSWNILRLAQKEKIIYLLQKN